MNVTDSQYLSDAGGIRDYTQYTHVLSRLIAIGTPLSVFSSETVTWLACKLARAWNQATQERHI